VILQLLSLFSVTVTSSQFSHVIIQQPKDVNSCGRNEQVLSEILTLNSELHGTVSLIRKDIAKLNAGGAHENTTGELRKIIAYNNNKLLISW